MTLGIAALAIICPPLAGQTIDLEPTEPQAYRAFGLVYRSVSYEAKDEADAAFGPVYSGPVVGAFFRVPEWLGGLRLTALYGPEGDTLGSLVELGAEAWADRVIAGEGAGRVAVFLNLLLECRLFGEAPGGSYASSKPCDTVIGAGAGVESRLSGSAVLSARGWAGLVMPLEGKQQDRWIPAVGSTFDGEATVAFEGLLGGRAGLAVGGAARLTTLPQFLAEPEGPDTSRWADFSVREYSVYMAVIW